MDCFESIKKRRSIRAYKDKPISAGILDKLVDAARFAPTARNVQPWQFVVVTNKKALDKIAKLAENGRFISQAAVCIAVFCNDTKYYLEDGCAATQNILLAATAEGIGSCWVAGDKKPYSEDINKMFGVPISYKLVSLVALGYPAFKNAFVEASKEPLSKMVHQEKF